MGKRTNFERKARDFYPTPFEAVAPLLPHLPERLRFDEPCAGDGALIRHLDKHGHVCTRATDLDPAEGDPDFGIQIRDAMTLENCFGEMFITNPPWKWGVLKDLMPHLISIAPTWLLLNADVMHNRRMGKHMKQCAKVISIGRISWMGNGQTGYENCAWFLFNKTYSGPTQFVGRGE